MTGSIREVVDDQGSLTARVDYSPWGELETVSGSFDLDFGFTGHFIHQPTGLYLAPFRAYDAGLGRWLSREPAGFVDGPNLYAYAQNSPIIAVDPLGLWSLWNPATWGDPNPPGWSVRNSLTPWHESAGYTAAGLAQSTKQGAAAFADGFLDVIPFVDIRPFEKRGVYDSCEYGLGASRAIGGVTRDILLVLGGAAAWKATPVLGGGQLSTQTSVGLSLAGVTPLGQALFGGGSGLTSSLSFGASFAATWGSRISTANNFLDEIGGSKCKD